MTEFPNKLKELRISSNLKQSELGERLNVSQVAISKWETGVHSPDIEQLITIAKYFEVSTDYLLGLED